MRSMVEGPLPTPKNPSTSLRLVPLPGECRGGFELANYPAPTASDSVAKPSRLSSDLSSPAIARATPGPR